MSIALHDGLRGMNCHYLDTHATQQNPCDRVPAQGPVPDYTYQWYPLTYRQCSWNHQFAIRWVINAPMKVINWQL